MAFSQDALSQLGKVGCQNWRAFVSAYSAAGGEHGQQNSTGIHFEVDMHKVLQPFVSLGLRTFFHAVDTMLHQYSNSSENSPSGDQEMDANSAQSVQRRLFNFSLNCTVSSNHRWQNGPEFYR